MGAGHVHAAQHTTHMEVRRNLCDSLLQGEAMAGLSASPIPGLGFSAAKIPERESIGARTQPQKAGVQTI